MLQEHLYDPPVFKQMWSHPPLLVRHSLMSKNKDKIILMHSVSDLLSTGMYYQPNTVYIKILNSSVNLHLFVDLY